MTTHLIAVLITESCKLNTKCMKVAAMPGNHVNSFRTESRSQRFGLHTIAYGKPLTADLHK